MLDVTGVPRDFEAHLPLHPERPALGTRPLKVHSENGMSRLWLSTNDRAAFEKSNIVRLMELFNVELESASQNSISAKNHSQDY